MKKSQILRVILVAIIIVIVAQTRLYSQWNPKTLKVSFVSESVSIPFGQLVINPVHPGISIGTDLKVKDQTSWHRSVGVEATYYYHRLYEQAIMIDAVYNFGYAFRFGLQTSLIGAIGYKHSILSGETYHFENGEYVKKKHPGKPQVNAKIGFGLSYPVNNKICINADYLGMIALPYSPKQGMPFSTHALLKIGTSIKL